MQQTHYIEIDELMRIHNKEILACKMDVERAMEIVKLKEKEIRMKNEEFDAEIFNRQKHLDALTNEITHLKRILDELKLEIDVKQRDIEQVKEDALKDYK